MKILTQDAVLRCDHGGRVSHPPTQDFVTVNGRLILVDNNPENKSIAGCPNIGATIKPCQRTLRVEVGYSTFITIEERSICLDTVVGKTDGTPPGVVMYRVKSPGQVLVSEAE